MTQPVVVALPFTGRWWEWAGATGHPALVDTGVPGERSVVEPV